MTENTVVEDFPKNEAEFDKRFSTPQACYEYLFAMRWPDGFVCSTCGCRQCWKSSRGLYICCKCEHQHSLTAGTVFHSSKKPITSWFKAMWWFTTRKSGVNAVNLQSLLGLGSYTTAWCWLQKLRSCTIRPDREKLSGTVEVDEFYLGGECSGKRGRGAEHKCSVAAAVEKKGRKLGRIRLQLIDDCSQESLTQFMNRTIDPGSHVITDGWSGYGADVSKNYDHEKVLQSKAEDRFKTLPGVHLVSSLVKRLILGTFQGRFDKKHLQRYLDEYVFRFNRRNSTYVGKKFMRIVQQAMLTLPNPYYVLIQQAEPLLEFSK
jgi:transposase-like protein